MNRAFGSLLVLALAFWPGTAEAACWKCDENSRCKEVESGKSGKDACFSYEICVGLCEEYCSTDGADPCKGASFPPQPDTRSVIIPNGEALEWEILRPSPGDETAPADHEN